MKKGLGQCWVTERASDPQKLVPLITKVSLLEHVKQAKPKVNMQNIH